MRAIRVPTSHREEKPGERIGEEQFSLRALLVFFSLAALFFSLIRASWLPKFLERFFLFAAAMLMLQWFALAVVARRIAARRESLGEAVQKKDNDRD